MGTIIYPNLRFMEAETLLAIPLQGGTQYFGLTKIGDFWYPKGQKIFTGLRKTLDEFFAEDKYGRSPASYETFLDETRKAGGQSNVMTIPTCAGSRSRSTSRTASKTTIPIPAKGRDTLGAPAPRSDARRKSLQASINVMNEKYQHFVDLLFTADSKGTVKEWTTKTKKLVKDWGRLHDKSKFPKYYNLPIKK